MAEPYGNYHATDGRPSGDYGGEHLVVRSVPVPDPGDLIGRLPEPAALAWIRHGAGLTGWGEAARVALPSGPDRFAVGEKWLREVIENADVQDEARRRGSGLVAFGSFTFDDWSEGSVLIVPRAVLGRDGTGNAWLTTITPDGEAAWHAAPQAPLLAPGHIRWHDGSLSAPEWEQAVSAAVRRIIRGELRKVVLARDIYASADEPIDARVLLRRLADRYPGCFTFACAGWWEPRPSCSSAGTAARSAPLCSPAPCRGAPRPRRTRSWPPRARLREGQRRTRLRRHLADRRDRTAVPGAADSPRPELLRFANVQHLGTWVHGTLATDHSALALSAALHPTAAVGGTPTDTAVELIRELENMDRERYAGPVGWVDADGNGEWGIALRCAQLAGERARLFAGCGIVAGSDPAAELAEAQVKFRPMQTALEQGD